MTNQKIITNGEIGEMFDNPIMKHQVTGNHFLKDTNGEVRLKGDFIGEKDYVSLDEIILEKKEGSKKIILNIGDSSTCGWDSEIVLLNQKIKQKKGLNFSVEDAIFPLFQYKTYSDCIREKVQKDYIVINAGIPTHTSLNGLKRLKDIISRFEEKKIKIDYVTIYYGNNDCACNANVEEKYRTSGKIRRLYNRLKGFNRVVPRTSKKDFIKNIASILSYSRIKGIVPLIIEPPTPLYWEPGRRIKRENPDISDEVDEQVLMIRNKNGGKKLYDMYWRAVALWKEGIELYSKKNIGQAIRLLEEAKELDYIVPRIKSRYKDALSKLARKKKVPYVKIYTPRYSDDGRSGEGFFCDYTHPIEPANKMIAEGIIKAINDYETGKNIKPKNEKELMKFRFLECLSNLFEKLYINDKKNNNEVKEMIYPLY